MGRILFLQSSDATKKEPSRIFSAERFVVSPVLANEGEVTSIITKSGFRVSKPFPEAEFLFAHFEVDTPSALFDAHDLLSAKLKRLALVELDGAGSGGGAPSDPSYSN